MRITIVLSLLLFGCSGNVENEKVRIAIEFSEPLLDASYRDHSADQIPNKLIKNAFNAYNVNKLSSVFKNRYTKTGELKSDLANRKINLSNWYIFHVEQKKANELIALLKKTVEVKHVTVDEPIILNIHQGSPDPNDDFFNNQWYLDNPSNPTFDINAPEAWTINSGRNDVIIAVLDGGINYNHPDLDPGDRSRIITGYDTGENDNDPIDDLGSGEFYGHGTKIAGTIGALTNNDRGVSGVMWNCKIMPVKMVRSIGIRIPHLVNWNWVNGAFPSDVADALDYAVNNGADIINLSYSFPDTGFPIEEVIFQLPLLYQAIDNAYRNDVIITASMGNEFASNNSKRYPAGFNEQVMAVGATNPNGTRRSSSNTGDHIDIAAPGTNIYTTEIGTNSYTNAYGYTSGTSYSAPITAAAAGLVLSHSKDRNIYISNEDVRNILTATATDVNTPGYDEHTGHGIVNAHAALQLIDEPNEVLHATSYGGTSTNTNNFSQFILLTGRWGTAAGSYLNVDEYKITKHINFPTEYCDIPEVWIRGKNSKSIRGGNPNFAKPDANIYNITTTGFDVDYNTYFLRTNTLGQTVNKWVPATPSSTKFDYTVIGQPLFNSNLLINGDFTFKCQGATANFSLSNMDNISSISWSTSNGLQINGPTNNSTVQVQVIGNGIQIITATITSGCASVSKTITKQVNIGIPSLTVTRTDDRTPQASNYTYHSASVQQINGLSNNDYKWYYEVNNSPTTLIATGPNMNNLPIPPCSSVYYQLRVNTDCGVAINRGYAYNYYGCGYGYTIYSNPVAQDKNLTVEEKKIDGTVKLQNNEFLELIDNNQKSISYKIINKNGKEFKSGYLNEKSTLNLGDLNSGQYFILIRKGKFTEQYQFYIE